MSTDNQTVEQIQTKLEAKRLEAGLPPNGQATTPIANRATVASSQVETATCSECGETFSYQRVGPARRFRCDSCSEAIEAERDAERAAYQAQHDKREKERLARRLLENLERCGVNMRDHGRCTLDNFDTAESGELVVKLCRSFVEGARDAGPYDAVRGLYLWGDTGCGKSHLAVAVLRELQDQPGNCTWSTMLFDRGEELMLRIQDTYGTDQSTFDVLDKRTAASVWVLDDLGTERASDDVARHLTHIFAKRALAPTVVTSNLSPEQLEADRPELF